MKNIVYFFIILYSSFIYSQESDIKLPIDPDTGCELRYDFYPNYDAYYDRKRKVFLFYNNGIWTEGETIPNAYRGYSIYNNFFHTIKDYDGDDIIKLYPYHRKIYPYINSKTPLKKNE